MLFRAADFDRYPEVLARLEEPQCSATALPIYLLYQACRAAGLTVILTGEGADELLGGYHWFQGDAQARPLLGWPRPLRRLIAAQPLPMSDGRGRRVLRAGPADDLARYAQWQNVGQGEAVLSPELCAAAGRAGRPGRRSSRPRPAGATRSGSSSISRCTRGWWTSSTSRWIG